MADSKNEPFIPINCICSTWARSDTDTGGLLNHHETCPDRKRYDGVREFAKRIVAAFDCWASDEDGVHPEAWEAYQEARMVAGLPVAEIEPTTTTPL